MTESRRRDRWLRRFVLAGGIGLGLVAGGGAAWAYWSDSASDAGRPLTSGRLDLTVDGQLAGPGGQGGTVAMPTLTLPTAWPGSSDAAQATVANAGDVPFTLTVTATPTGDLAADLTTTVRYGGTDVGTACAGGTTTPPVLYPSGRGTPTSVTVCVSVTLTTTAPSSDQGLPGGVSVAYQGVQVP